MEKTKKTNDLTEGNLIVKLLIYALPVLATGVLQLLYNAADIVVVGQYVGENALASVGATGAVSNLITSLFIGLSVGTCVVVANCIGAKDDRGVYEAVHTSIAIGAIFGVVVSVIGFFIARPVLIMMDVPVDGGVLDGAVKYMKIIFLGMPAQMIYNYGAAILRAKGDTKHPLYILIITGLVNVVLNLVLVINFGLDVDGVAIATITAQYLSAIMVVILLCRIDDCCRLNLKELKIYPARFKKIFYIGITAGVQSALFSISNVMIQSSVNSFGPVAMAGNTAAQNIDGFIYIACNSFYHAAVTFSGQHLGAGKIKRIRKVVLCCLMLVTVVGLLIGVFAYAFGPELISIYVSSEEVNYAKIVEYAMIRLGMLALTYFLCGTMEVMTGALRGIGFSLGSMIISLLGACALRVVWIITIFKVWRTPFMLYLSFPVSWIVTTTASFVVFLIYMRRLERQAAGEAPKKLRLLPSLSPAAKTTAGICGGAVALALVVLLVCFAYPTVNAKLCRAELLTDVYKNAPICVEVNDLNAPELDTTSGGRFEGEEARDYKAMLFEALDGAKYLESRDSEVGHWGVMITFELDSGARSFYIDGERIYIADGRTRHYFEPKESSRLLASVAELLK